MDGEVWFMRPHGWAAITGVKHPMTGNMKTHESYNWGRMAGRLSSHLKI